MYEEITEQDTVFIEREGFALESNLLWKNSSIYSYTPLDGIMGYIREKIIIKIS